MHVIKFMATTIIISALCLPMISFAETTQITEKANKIVAVLRENNFKDLSDARLRSSILQKLGPDLGGNPILQREMAKYTEPSQIEIERKAPIIFNDGKPVPTEKKVLIYKCDKTVLQCQNSAEDIAAGRIEFENELRNHYGNRIIVENIIYDPNEQLETVDDFKKMLKPGQKAVILKINLEGQGAALQEYQNMFGAKVGGYIPTTKVHINEAFCDSNSTKLVGRDYGIKEYHPQSYAVYGRVYSTQNDPRKQVKNNIRGCIRDLCKFYGDQINKYSNPQKYQIEVYRFLCRPDDLLQ